MLIGRRLATVVLTGLLSKLLYRNRIFEYVSVSVSVPNDGETPCPPDPATEAPSSIHEKFSCRQSSIARYNTPNLYASNLNRNSEMEAQLLLEYLCTSVKPILSLLISHRYSNEDSHSFYREIE
jgi:hypothetical protein